MSGTVILTHMHRIVFLRTSFTVLQLFTVSPQLTQLYLFKDNAAVIQMIMKGRSPSWRHGTRTHGVDSDGLFQRTDSHHSVVLENVRTHDRLADFVYQGVIFLRTMEDTTSAVGDSNQLPPHTPSDPLTDRSIFATTVCSKDVRPMSSANHDTPMTVDPSKGPSVYEEEVLAPDALGEVMEEQWAQYSSRCLGACCTLSTLRSVVALRNQTCRNVQDKMERHAGMLYQVKTERNFQHKMNPFQNMWQKAYTASNPNGQSVIHVFSDSVYVSVKKEWLMHLRS